MNQQRVPSTYAAWLNDDVVEDPEMLSERHYMFEAEFGPLPPDVTLAPRCGTVDCVEPTHMLLIPAPLTFVA